MTLSMIVEVKEVRGNHKGILVKSPKPSIKEGFFQEFRKPKIIRLCNKNYSRQFVYRISCSTTSFHTCKMVAIIMTKKLRHKWLIRILSRCTQAHRRPPKGSNFWMKMSQIFIKYLSSVHSLKEVYSTYIINKK